MRSSPLGEVGASLAFDADLLEVSEGAHEVGCSDLIPCARVPSVAFEPAREPLVALGSDKLGQAVVGGVANHQVMETEGFLAGEARTSRADEVLTEQATERRSERVTVFVQRGELGYGAVMEDLAFDGGTLEGDPLVTVEPVKPSREHCLYGCRHGDVIYVVYLRVEPVAELQDPIISEHRHELLGKQGIPFRCLGDSRTRRTAHFRADELRDQALALRCGEPLEQKRRRVELPSGPCRPLLEQLWTGQAEEDNRRVARPVGDVVDEVEEH